MNTSGPTFHISMDTAGGNNGLYPIVTDLSDLDDCDDTTTDDSGMIRMVVTADLPQQQQQSRRRTVRCTQRLKLEKPMVGHRRAYSEGTVVSFLFPDEDGSCSGSGSGNTEEESTSSAFTATSTFGQQQQEDRSDCNRRFDDLYVLTQRVSAPVADVHQNVLY